MVFSSPLRQTPSERLVTPVWVCGAEIFLPHPWSLSSHKRCLQNWSVIGHCLPGLLSATLEWLRLCKGRRGKWLTGWLSTHRKRIFWRVSDLFRWLRCFLCESYPPPPSASLLVSISPSSAVCTPLTTRPSLFFRLQEEVSCPVPLSYFRPRMMLRSEATFKPYIGTATKPVNLGIFVQSHIQRTASLIGIKIIFSLSRGCMSIFKQLHLTKIEQRTLR